MLLDSSLEDMIRKQQIFFRSSLTSPR
jgi:hypothetical protein